MCTPGTHESIDRFVELGCSDNALALFLFTTTRACIKMDIKQIKHRYVKYFSRFQNKMERYVEQLKEKTNFDRDEQFDKKCAAAYTELCKKMQYLLCMLAYTVDGSIYSMLTNVEVLHVDYIIRNHKITADLMLDVFITDMDKMRITSLNYSPNSKSYIYNNFIKLLPMLQAECLPRLFNYIISLTNYCALSPDTVSAKFGYMLGHLDHEKNSYNLWLITRIYEYISILNVERFLDYLFSQQAAIPLYRKILTEFLEMYPDHNQTLINIFRKHRRNILINETTLRFAIRHKTTNEYMTNMPRTYAAFLSFMPHIKMTHNLTLESLTARILVDRDPTRMIAYQLADTALSHGLDKLYAEFIVRAPPLQRIRRRV